ncbi:hypothetical protein LSAT2_012409 [Lamellibrachia satsuma]|nr:hypothetical protein LSAT2_012409 [Lamellibrachia satsuma]
MWKNSSDAVVWQILGFKLQRAKVSSCQKLEPTFGPRNITGRKYPRARIVDTQFYYGPINSVHVVGGETWLSCTGKNLAWDKYVTGEENPLSVSSYLNGTKTDKHDMYDYSFLINGTTLQDAGRYRCKYVPVQTLYVDAEVIVLESHPKCTTNATNAYFAIEGDYIKFSCEVTYAGKWAPVFTWFIGENIAGEVKK